MIKPLTLAVAIGYALSSSLGCVTYALWGDASTTTISGPRVRQIDPGVDGRGMRAVVNYRVGDCGDEFGRFDRALPLGADGVPDWPFVYRGEQMTMGEIARDLPEAQKQAILRTELARIDRVKAGAAGASSGMHSPATTGGAKVMRNWSPVFYTGCDSQVGVVILSPDPLRVWPAARGCAADAELADVRVRPGEVVVLVPISLPRPAGDLACSRLGATLLTPPAVAADAALVGVVAVAAPLFIILAVTGVLPRC